MTRYSPLPLRLFVVLAALTAAFPLPTYLTAAHDGAQPADKLEIRPDGAENNKRLALYTAAMAEVARANKVVFVDLFQPSRQLYAKASRPLTINGIHLNEYGNELVAKVTDQALFGGRQTGASDVKQ